MLASARTLRNFAEALAALGFDQKRILRKASLRWTDVESGSAEEHRIPVAALGRFWAAAVEVTGDPAIGVRIGALARLDKYGLLGSVARASATLGDALLKTVRYTNLLIETARLYLLVEGNHGQVIYRSIRVPPAAADAALTQLLVLSRELTGRALVPTRVQFAHRAPADDSIYREVFGVAPTFDDFDHSLVFPLDDLMLPIATHDSRKAEHLLAQANRLADELSPGDSISKRHGDLLDSLRREHAQRYLGMPSLSLAETAFLLGFSDASAFNEAFRRWFGETPLEFRARLAVKES
jgi:AraC-like DNA-binding protein